jgi:hypothetical protein
MARARTNAFCLSIGRPLFVALRRRFFGVLGPQPYRNNHFGTFALRQQNGFVVLRFCFVTVSRRPSAQLPISAQKGSSTVR